MKEKLSPVILNGAVLSVISRTELFACYPDTCVSTNEIMSKYVNALPLRVFCLNGARYRSL